MGVKKYVLGCRLQGCTLRTVMHCASSALFEVFAASRVLFFHAHSKYTRMGSLVSYLLLWLQSGSFPNFTVAVISSWLFAGASWDVLALLRSFVPP